MTALLCQSASARDLTLLDRDEWKVLMGGFIGLDSISDSTRSFNESMGSSPVSRSTGSGRTQFSVRNTRLGFTIVAPESESWKTLGKFEFDFLGTNPAAGSASGATEASFYNNPTTRMRHAYFQSEKNGWQVLAGQTWAMFGWQPYYFVPTIQVPSVSGMAFSRTAQLRVMKTNELSSSASMQSALGLMRPPQRDSSYPAVEGGLRFILNSRASGFTGSATGVQKAQPMSIGVSGTYRDIGTPKDTTKTNGSMDHHSASAFAVNALIPVIASHDGKDASNTLTFGGEFTSGRGYGDQFAGYTGNLPNPLNTVKTGPQASTSLDGGIGDYDANGKFHLVQLQTYNLYFQYHLPAGMRSWIGGGFGEMTSNNIRSLTTTNGLLSSGNVPYKKNQNYFLNVSHDLSERIRVGLEYANTKTSYTDGLNTQNHRYQISFWFML